jgi:copper chaperone
MRFHIENMTCGHCERSIRKAIAALSPQDKVAIDLRGKIVDIEGTASAARIVAALADEGYAAVRVIELP